MNMCDPVFTDQVVAARPSSVDLHRISAKASLTGTRIGTGWASRHGYTLKKRASRTSILLVSDLGYGAR